MPLPVVISPRAANEILRARTWWKDNRPAAPGAIDSDLQAALNLLATQPFLGVRCANSRTPELRRLYLNRVGHFLYYKVESGELHVLAFWHAKRGRGPKV